MPSTERAETSMADKEREAFEAWYEGDALACGCEHSNWFRRDADGDYEIDHVEWTWRGWKYASLSSSGAGDAAVETTDAALQDAYAEGRKDEREEAQAALMRTRVAYYMHGRDQAAEFARNAGYPELASSIAANWAEPGWLPPLCESCGGEGDREVFVQSGGSMPWNAGDGHDETVNCPDCKGTGFAIERAVIAQKGKSHE